LSRRFGTPKLCTLVPGLRGAAGSISWRASKTRQRVKGFRNVRFQKLFEFLSWKKLHEKVNFLLSFVVKDIKNLDNIFMIQVTHNVEFRFSYLKQFWVWHSHYFHSKLFFLFFVISFFASLYYAWTPLAYYFKFFISIFKTIFVRLFFFLNLIWFLLLRLLLCKQGRFDHSWKSWRLYFFFFFKV